MLTENVAAERLHLALKANLKASAFQSQIQTADA